MSKELPYFRFYPDEWLTGNITLEDEQTQGLFILICCWYWKKDCLIDIDFIKKRLINGQAMLEQCLNKLISMQILKKNDDGSIDINFLNEQYDLLNESRQKRVNAGRLGGKQSSSNAQAMPKQSSSYKDKDKEIEIAFSDFWILYDKKVGEKNKLEKKWLKLSDDDRTKIMQHIPKYKLSQPEKQYRKNPETYLNNKAWNDEIISDQPIPQAVNFIAMSCSQVAAYIKALPENERKQLEEKKVEEYMIYMHGPDYDKNIKPEYLAPTRKTAIDKFHGGMLP